MNEEETAYYEISRYQDECTLRSKLRQKTFKQTDKIEIILGVANALRMAHNECVYHRDVCPENIYIYEGGKSALANFGLSWFVEHNELDFTVEADVNVNSLYSAPELRQGDVCQGSDIFSLGMVFYELMTGKLPFDSTIAFEAVMGGVLPKDMLPCSVCPDLPEWIDEISKNTIVANPEDRWQTADGMI